MKLFTLILALLLVFIYAIYLNILSECVLCFLMGYIMSGAL